MQLVATLVCDPARPMLTDALLRRAAAVLPSAAAPVWLGAEIAADIAFEGDPAEAGRHVGAVRDVVAALPVDIVVQPAAGRRKGLLLADMDSTMIGQECIDELADLIGQKAHVAAITEQAMRGEIAFEPALKARVALLAGLPADVVAQVIAERITLTPGARALVATMRAGGATSVLVSGGFTVFTAVIAEKIGFDAHHANELLIAEGRFSGAVAEPILGRAAKRATLLDWRARLGLDPAATMAVGDGANDLAMLEAAGLGVAYHAKPAVAAAAHARIAYADLTALLYVQGYRRADFVVD